MPTEQDRFRRVLQSCEDAARHGIGPQCHAQAIIDWTDERERLDWLACVTAERKVFIEGHGWMHLDRKSIDSARKDEGSL